MKFKNKQKIASLIAGFILIINQTHAAFPLSSSSYKIDMSSFGGTGSVKNSDNYKLNNTITETFTGGQSGSASYLLDTGLVNLEQFCGNSILEFGEACDDGNTTNNDGCSSTCQIEAAVCGNSILETGEVCDDGNTTSGDGCSNTCQTEIITPAPAPSGGGGGGGGLFFFICGNGIKQGIEQCDDGNNINGDGCSGICRLEEGTKEETGEEAEEKEDPEKEETEEEADDTIIGPARTLTLKVTSEKRVNANRNQGIEARVLFYNKKLRQTTLSTPLTINQTGWGQITSGKLPDGTYDIIIKGQSHLSKVIRNQVIDETSRIIDFTFNNSSFLIAGDVHESKDDFINSLDISATTQQLYTSNIDADLNRDGIVNALDLSIVVSNLYKTGEKI